MNLRFIDCISYISSVVQNKAAPYPCICNTSSSYLMGVIVCEAVVTLSTCLCFSDECTWLLCVYLAMCQPLWMGQEPGYRALIVLLCGMGCMPGPGSSERNGVATHRPHWGERVHGGGGFTSLCSHTSYLSDFSSLPLYTLSARSQDNFS